MNKKFAIVLALSLIAIVCCAGCIDPQDPVDPVDPVVPVDPVDPVTPPVEPVVPAVEYSVFFMLNYDGAGAYSAETVTAGDAVSKPATPTRSGYTFKGWFTAAEGGAEYDFTQAVNADLTLYAQWSKKSSSGGSSTPKHTHSYGSWASNNDGTHTKSCSCGGSSVTEHCKFSGFVCTICRYEGDVYHIYNLEELQNFATAVNGGESFSGKTVMLEADIDLGNTAWSPIGTDSNTFAGTFDGNEKTISNLNAAGTKGVGFFGYAYPSATIKNLIVKNAVISGSDYLGGIVGSSYGSIIDCSVENVTLTATPANGDGGAKVGGIVGYLGEGSYIVSENSAKDVKITAFRDAGGIAGMAQYGTTVSDNNVDKLTIIIDQATNYYPNTNQINAGDVVGRIGTSGSSTVTLSDNTATDVDIKYIVGSNDALKKVLSLDVEKIDVTLANDVTYSIDAWMAEAMGGVSTEDITINGDGKTLTFKYLNSDWNNVVTNGAKLSINNAKVTHEKHESSRNTWNGHDIIFNCTVSLTDVEFDCSIALKRDTTLNNVKITDTVTSDIYGIWISPNGQTISINDLEMDMTGATDGRGIKIDEQYVSSPAKVTLNINGATFKTEEKAAILVKSAAGADITLSGIDISGVTADSTNAVWIDSDLPSCYGAVTVTGGTKILEPVESTAKLLNAVKIDGITIQLAAGKTFENVVFTGSTIGDDVTIVGTPTSTVKGISLDLPSFTTNSELKGLTLDGINFADKGVYITNHVGNAPWGFIDNLKITGCYMRGTGSTNSENVIGNRLFDTSTDSFGSHQIINITIEDCVIENVAQGIRLGGLHGSSTIKDNEISNVYHNAITLRSVSGDVLVEGNEISNGNDRAFRIGTLSSGTVTYKDNTITNTGDSGDGTNFKINDLNGGSIVFAGNTVDGVSWNPSITGAGSA